MPTALRVVTIVDEKMPSLQPLAGKVALVTGGSGKYSEK
jgi:hypothetical protein